MALIPNPLPVRWYGQSAHASAHHEAALSIKTVQEGKGHLDWHGGVAAGSLWCRRWRRRLAAEGESAMLDFLPGIHDATWVSGEIVLARTTTATRSGSTRPATTPGEPPTLALAAEAIAIVGIYLVMRGIWRVRRKPSGVFVRSIDPPTRATSSGEAAKVRDRDAA